MDAPLIDEAAAVLAAGGVVVVPTETVYGLVATPDDAGVASIVRLKRRGTDAKHIQLLIPRAAMVRTLGEPSERAIAIAGAFWPGPLTLVVRASASAPAALSGDGTIGLRVPDHPVALALLERTGPLAASSANRTGEPTPTDLDGVRAVFGDEVGGYLDGGRIPGGMGSTVVDVTGPEPKLLRAGLITMQEITRVSI